MKNGSCRIIAGKWRGRKVSFDDAAGLRPTTDRIRETVFNWLQPYIYQSRCLDAFAGSGLLGIEALSRGAEEVVFIEKNTETAVNLKDNLSRLNASHAIIHNADVLEWLPSAHQDERYNLIFLDPPFRHGLLETSSVTLNSSGILADDAIIYVEHEADAQITLPENWVCLKDKCAGQVSYKLFENQII